VRISTSPFFRRVINSTHLIVQLVQFARMATSRGFVKDRLSLVTQQCHTTCIDSSAKAPSLRVTFFSLAPQRVACRGFTLWRFAWSDAGNKKPVQGG